MPELAVAAEPVVGSPECEASVRAAARPSFGSSVASPGTLSACIERASEFDAIRGRSLSTAVISFKQEFTVTGAQESDGYLLRKRAKLKDKRTRHQLIHWTMFL
jgi:hypothetical protein